MRLRIRFLTLLASIATVGCSADVANEDSVKDVFLANGPRLIAQTACEDDIDALKIAIDQHPSAINAKGLYDVTPLIWALTCRGLEFPDLGAGRFIERAAQTADRKPNVPNLKLLELLLNEGADPNSFVSGEFGPVYPGEASSWIDGYSPVLIATEFHEPDVLKILLRYGGDPNAKSRSHEHSALSLALSRGRWLDLGQKLSPFDDSQWQNYFTLLDAGADPNEKLGVGQNVVEVASMNRPEIVLRTLKEYQYVGEYDMIVDYTILAIENGYPNSDTRWELLEYLREEKGIKVDDAIESYRAHATVVQDSLE